MPKKKSCNAVYVFSVLREAKRLDTEDWWASEIQCIRSDFDFVIANPPPGKHGNYIFQLEQGTVANKLHWQCFLKLHTKLRPNALKNLLNDEYQDSNPYRAQICSVAGKHALANYCMKTATRVPGVPLQTLRKVYRGQDLLPMQTPLPWQADLLSIMDQEPDFRTIHWIYNPSGNIGKSMFTKWCVYNKKAEDLGQGSATQLKTSILNCPVHRVYICDIPRTCGKEEHMADIISTIESLKNGNVSSPMYGKHARTLFMPPHIIVFANKRAPFTFMSLDRWKTFIVRSRTDHLERDHYRGAAQPAFNIPAR